MIPRLYTDRPLTPGEAAPLSIEHCHYLRNVLRRVSGDALLMFNERDGEFEARLDRLDKKAGVAVIGAQTRSPAAEPEIVLLVAVVKRGPLEMIVQKATELGVSRIQLVKTERTSAPRVNSERLQAIAMEAAEQAGRLSVPDIGAPERLANVLDDWNGASTLIYCDESGDDPDQEWGGQSGRADPLYGAVVDRCAPDESIAVLIGPEGGFSSAERQKLRAQDFVLPVTLGPRILRADTAAIAALTLAQAAIGDFRRR